VGYDRIAGMLDGRAESWRAAGLRIASTGDEPVARAVRPGRRVLDVRRRPEWDSGHIEGATHVPLAQLPGRTGELDRAADWVVVCASGYRSGIATSVLERAGFPRVTNAAGGMDAWRRDGLPIARD
jgi:hydroxyacylglutathione hydrolase